MDDEKYMRRCLQLAANGIQGTRPNPMVGAVIVAPNPERIIGEGFHVRCGQGHAEVNAFASVRPEDESQLKDATVYVSLEHVLLPPDAETVAARTFAFHQRSRWEFTGILFHVKFFR